MTALPGPLAAAVDALLQGNRLRPLAQRAQLLSEGYRRSRPSAEVIGGRDDAIAYALSRMPATHAAVARVLDELQARAPEFAPRTLLDIGTGPGTAAWAAAETFASLGDAVLVDSSRAFLALARELGEASPLLASARYEAGDLRQPGPAERHDLVTCAYALTELPDDAVVAAAARLWERCAGVLVLVEPGRPRDFRRLLEIRAALVAAGAALVAPCPHAADCPLPAPDWCHFSVRLPRGREHMRLKGGQLAYEDEKFSYLVLARPDVATAAAPARLIHPPRSTKFSVELTLCTPEGIAGASIAKRDGEPFRRARKLAWGDATERPWRRLP